MSPRNMMAHLHLQALGSIFVLFYDLLATVDIFETASTLKSPQQNCQENGIYKRSPSPTVPV
jgi:hypothetical protein